MKTYLIIGLILLVVDFFVSMSHLTKLSKKSFHSILWGLILLFYSISFSKLLEIKQNDIFSKIVLIGGIVLSVGLFVLSYVHYRGYERKLVNPDLSFLILVAKRLDEETSEDADLSKLQQVTEYMSLIADLSADYINSIVDDDKKKYQEISEAITIEKNRLNENGIIFGENHDILNFEKIYELI